MPPPDASINLPCIECRATCCKSHRGVLLDDGSILPFINDRCPHLGEDDRCQIYDRRPRGCREFDCSRDASFRRGNPVVAALLTVHRIPLSDA